MIPVRLLQQFCGQVGEPAGSVAAVDEFARPAAGKLNQFCQRRHAERRNGRNEHGRSAEVTDRGKVARHFNREIGGRPRQRHKRRESGDEKRIAVGGGTRSDARRNGAASTRLVDRQDLLAPDLAQPIGDNSQGDVNGAAGPRVRDDLHRPRGIILGLRRQSGGRRYRQQQRHEAEPIPVCVHVAHERSTCARPSARTSTVAGLEDIRDCVKLHASDSTIRSLRLDVSIERGTNAACRHTLVISIFG